LRGEVSSVSLDDGRTIPCEIVIVAIGVRPRLEALAGSGIKTNRGIVVDRFMKTSATDIYACGDAAESYDFIYGENRLTPVWPNAYEGGRVAGLNMAGQSTEYQGGTAMNSLKYFGLHIVSAGLVIPPDNSYEVISSRENNNYRKVIIKNGKLEGLVFAGDIEKSGIVYNLMKDGVNVDGFKKVLVADDFGLASLPENTWRSKIDAPTTKSVPITPDEEPEEALIGD
jgi:NAD(P)H-nitrite reductase large subunit